MATAEPGRGGPGGAARREEPRTSKAGTDGWGAAAAAALLLPGLSRPAREPDEVRNARSRPAPALLGPGVAARCCCCLGCSVAPASGGPCRRADMGGAGQCRNACASVKSAAAPVDGHSAGQALGCDLSAGRVWPALDGRRAPSGGLATAWPLDSICCACPAQPIQKISPPASDAVPPSEQSEAVPPFPPMPASFTPLASSAAPQLASQGPVAGRHSRGAPPSAQASAIAMGMGPSTSLQTYMQKSPTFHAPATANHLRTTSASPLSPLLSPIETTWSFTRRLLRLLSPSAYHRPLNTCGGVAHQREESSRATQAPVSRNTV